MHVLFLLQGSTHLIDVQRYFAGIPQGLSPVFGFGGFYLKLLSVLLT